MATSKFTAEAEWSQLYVDGEWVESSSGETVSVENPATGEAFAAVPAGTEADVDAAYEAADRAQPEWAALDHDERLSYLEDFYEAVKEQFGEIVELLARESGSIRGKASDEVGIALSDLQEGLSVDPLETEEVRQSQFFKGKEHHIVEEPVGVVGIISPWNYPFHLTTRAVGPALALGNTVVLKPATDTPITGGLSLGKIADEVGLPDGVVNVVTGKGSDIGDHFAGHSIPRVISFTGSTDVGKRVARNAGETIALPALELGGNAPFVVMPDSNVGNAAKAGAVGSFTHQGQACISINRHLVHEELYEEYVNLLSNHAESLTVGDPLDPDTDFGPVVNETQRDDLLEFIERTVEQGATLETGGEADNLFVEPTVLSNATNDMAAACNEHFGPVAPVIPFSTEDEAIELANDTNYGLSAAVYSGDIEHGRELADRIQAGMVHVNDHPIQEEPNAPFGGMKESGLGRYHGEWIVDELTETKWISVQEESRDYDLL